ncbi:hypothetical protein ACR1PO_15855 [Chryseobacterium sp. RRHN12]|uniref:hypothetical protein n=1 Tax=Chryseobacterium sp. RRHN12 TaxID=3437884 RepID=UPI003D9B7759
MEIKFTKLELERFKERDILMNLARGIEDKYYKAVEKRVIKALKLCKCIEDIERIKNSLRPYPDCATKVFLFRAIILREERIKSGI